MAYGDGLIQPPRPAIDILNGSDVIGSRYRVNIYGPGIGSIADDSTNNRVNIQVVGGGTSTGAPVDGNYLIIGTSSTLTGYRTLTAGTGISIADSGAQSAVTFSVTPGTTLQLVDILKDATSIGQKSKINFTGNVAVSLDSTNDRIDVAINGAPVDATYVALSSSSSLTNERILAASTGISITDNGAGNNVTIGVVPNSTKQKIEVLNAGTSVGIRSTLNFTGTGILSIDDDSTNDRINLNIGGSGGGAPIDANYLVLTETNPSLTNQRILTAGTGISFVDLGANNNLTVSVVSNSTNQKVQVSDSTGVVGTRRNIRFTGAGIGSIVDDSANDRVDVTINSGAPADAPYILLGTNNTNLSNERVLTAGTGITISDSGAGNAATLSVTANSTNQKVNILFNGTDKGTRKTLNLAGNCVANITDNATDDRVDIGLVAAPRDGQFVVISAHADLTSERVLTAGTGIAIADDSGNSKVTVSVQNNTTTQKVQIMKDGLAVGSARKAINFSGPAVADVVEDTASDRINVTLDVVDPTPLYYTQAGDNLSVSLYNLTIGKIRIPSEVAGTISEVHIIPVVSDSSGNVLRPSWIVVPYSTSLDLTSATDGSGTSYYTTTSSSNTLTITSTTATQCLSITILVKYADGKQFIRNI